MRHVGTMSLRHNHGTLSQGDIVPMMMILIASLDISSRLKKISPEYYSDSIVYRDSVVLSFRKQAVSRPNVL